MSKNESMRITVPSQAIRLAWKKMSDTPFSPEEQFEIVQRWCDQQDHRKAYHVKRNARIKALLARAEELEKISTLAEAAGMSVKEYLEMEADNVGGGEDAA